MVDLTKILTNPKIHTRNAVFIAFWIPLMQRLLTKSLIAWKNNPLRKPLILKGVRQCGKTYLLLEFGKANYQDVAYFNFENNTPLQQLFEKDLDIKRLITELGVLQNKPILPTTTLIIFDEIQFCGKALTSLKYFCELAPEYHIVCAGSLLGLALSGPSSFPVGKVEFLTMYPMNFAEFILASGEQMLYDHMQALSYTATLSNSFASKLEGLLRIYLITGGMPEVVASWIKTGDITKVEEIQQRIIDGYELDFAKHAKVSEFPKLTLIWRSIPNQLARESGKFIFSHAKKGLRAKDLEDALEWLINAGLVYKVAKIEKPGIPLSAYADQSYFKLYLSDVGLLGRMSKLPASAWLQESPTFKEFKGAVTENFVLTELVHLQNTTPYYWKSGNTAEVDFIIQLGDKIIPIEVKSERNTQAKSLTLYQNKYNPEVAIKTSTHPASGNGVKNIPLYNLWNLPKITD